MSAIGRTAIRLAFVRLASATVSKFGYWLTYVFDVGARMNGDNIAVLDTKIVANNAVHSSATVIQIIVGQDNQDGVFSLLALDEDCVASKEL